MKNIFYCLTLAFILLGFICCHPSKTIREAEQLSDPDEWINLEINELIEFRFEKYDDQWTGHFTLYTLKDDEKVVQRQFVSASDSSWDYFNNFVEFLDLYKIGPQHQIEGWYPDSENLPQRVYSFELYDGEKLHSYSYQDPEKELFKYWQSQNVVTFVTYVQNELNWREKSDE